MIGQYLSQTNESATIPILQNFLELNMALLLRLLLRDSGHSRVHKFAAIQRSAERALKLPTRVSADNRRTVTNLAKNIADPDEPPRFSPSPGVSPRGFIPFYFRLPRTDEPPLSYPSIVYV